MTASTPQSDRAIGTILVVSPWYKESLGGVAQVADRLFHLLIDAGIDSSLLVTHERNALNNIGCAPNLQNVWYQQIPSYCFHNLTCQAVVSTLIRGSATFWKIARFVKARKVQTIVLIFPTDSSWLFSLLRAVLGIRLIVSCHGNDITKFGGLSVLGRWIVRRVLKSADCIVVCADHLAKEVKELLPARRPPIVVIPNAVDVNHFTLPPVDFEHYRKQPTIIHVSNFAPKKRTLDIIEAFARADLPIECRLIMVGAGPDLKVAAERAQSLGLGQRVEFVGKQSDVRPFLWRASLFVLASDDEGAPLVLLEAMACGIPWVSTSWGVAATLPIGECGLVVPPDSSRQLAAAMGELINHPKQCQEMGLRGRKRVEADFTLDLYLQRHLKLIRGARTVEWLDQAAREGINHGTKNTR